jgi:predicted O-methyltransferase YrrM
MEAAEQRMKNYLPDFPALDSGLRLGRSVKDGYTRGWGIQFGALRDAVRSDPLYQKAARMGSGRSVVSEENRINLYLICRFFLERLEPGHIVEFGAYKGGNALIMASVAAELSPATKVFALDTYTGIPDADPSIDAHSAGDFGGVDLGELREHARRSGIGNIEFVQGRFEETAVALLSRIGRVSLAHIDSDTYASVAFAYDVVRPHMVPGGYLVFDDATVSSCLGATEAVETLLIRRDGMNAEQIWPHFVFRAPQTKDETR